jgi:hypothetical protein
MAGWVLHITGLYMLRRLRRLEVPFVGHFAALHSHAFCSLGLVAYNDDYSEVLQDDHFSSDVTVTSINVIK